MLPVRTALPPLLALFGFKWRIAGIISMSKIAIPDLKYQLCHYTSVLRL
jgi:hypothetical protein